MTTRRELLRWVTAPPFSPLWSWASRGGIPIFMLHRFRSILSEGEGLLESHLGDALHLLCARGFTFMSLDDALDSLIAGKPLKRAVVFTVDDGYSDFEAIALPIFETYSCPVTVFLSTGFIDGQWMWWDRIATQFASGALSTVRLQVGEVMFRFDRSGADWIPSPRVLISYLKVVPNSTRLKAIDELDTLFGIDLPKNPPTSFAPLTWRGITDAAKRGVTFGAHTVSHPILSRTHAAEARREIHDSFLRLVTMVPKGALSRVFCYPNGGVGDFTTREEETLASLGFLAGVTSIPGYAGILDSALPGARFRIPRFAFSDTTADLLQIVTGFEAVKMRIRRLS